MIDLETRIRKELMAPQPERIVVEGLTELAQKFRDLNEMVVDEMEKITKNTRSLLIEHLERVEKSNKTYQDQLEITSHTLQHLLNALLIDPDEFPVESELAWKQCKEVTKKYLESRTSN